MTRNDTTRNTADETNTNSTQSLGDVSHTHPYTKRSFGANFTFARGGAVAADGGRPDVVPEEDEAATDDGSSGGDEPATDDGSSGGDEPATLGDVAHVPPDGYGANPVFERGFEGHDAANRSTSRRGGQVASDD